MKRILSVLILLSAFFYAGAQGNTNADATLQLKETEHDFGSIPQGKPVYYTFTITNTGKQPLSLDNVQASCGCTIPEWNTAPIAPGASSSIRVGYNAAIEGNFEKFITVTWLGQQTRQLKIKGSVWKAPEGAAPVNAAVQFLKKQTL